MYTPPSASTAVIIAWTPSGLLAFISPESAYRLKTPSREKSLLHDTGSVREHTKTAWFFPRPQDIPHWRLPFRCTRNDAGENWSLLRRRSEEGHLQSEHESTILPPCRVQADSSSIFRQKLSMQQHLFPDDSFSMVGLLESITTNPNIAIVLSKQMSLKFLNENYPRHKQPYPHQAPHTRRMNLVADESEVVQDNA